MYRFVLNGLDEVNAIGWRELTTYHRQAIDIAKAVTGQGNESEAVSEFKSSLKSFSLYLTKHPFPLNESNSEAFEKCRTESGGNHCSLLKLQGDMATLFLPR